MPQALEREFARFAREIACQAPMWEFVARLHANAESVRFDTTTTSPLDIDDTSVKMPVCTPYPAQCGCLPRLRTRSNDENRVERYARTFTDPVSVEPQILPNEAKARQSSEAKPTNSSMDSIENR